jgi:hypothetical protein
MELEKPMSANQKRGFAMHRLQALPLVLGLLFASSATLVHAQSDAEKVEMPLTREQAKRDRDEFIKTHRWDTVTENWVLKSGVEPPTGMKSRAEVKMARDEFLRTHRYDQTEGNWVPVTGSPRNMSTLSRAQVKEETRQFIRTHQWDPVNDMWVEQNYRKKK